MFLDKKGEEMDYAALVTGLSTEVGTVFTSITPFVVLILGATIGYRLLKRFTS